jgi:hypothetical protein
MAKLRIQGDTSGYVDLEAPAAASGNTLDLDQIPQKNTTNTFTQDQLISGGDAITQEIRSSGNQAHFRMVSDLNNSAWMISNESNANRLRIMHTDTATSTNTFPIYLYESGYVTMPHQPAFRATNGSTNIGADVYIVFTSKDFDRTNSYNTTTGAFTAPVSGVYLFYITALYNYSTSTPTWKVNWTKNGAFDSVAAEIQTSQSGWNTQFNSTVTMNLSAGDYVQIYNDQSNVHISGIQTKFGGYLIG